MAQPNNSQHAWHDGPVLYENTAGNVILLDIPASISLAQGSSGSWNARWLLSTPAPEQPYPPTEPKSKTALARVEERLAGLTSPQAHRALISAGLEEIRREHKGPWCLPRRVPDASVQPAAGGPEPERRVSQVARSLPKVELPLGSHTLVLPTVAALGNKVISNPHDVGGTVRVSLPASTLLVPPHATFIAASISAQATPALSRALMSAAPEPSASAAPGQFDLIVLDPPWPNRSAQRSSAYRRATRMEDAFCGLKDVLNAHLAPSGVVACWITHAQTARAQAERVFEEWGVGLEEEWTWAKVTSSGEPVVAINSEWRRPWEVLLIGRRVEDGEHKRAAGRDMDGTGPPLLRLVASVADVHSRKPCLKALFEKHIPHTRERRVLEVFGRHLVSDWCTIGDEPCKFNWEGHWTNPPT